MAAVLTLNSGNPRFVIDPELGTTDRKRLSGHLDLGATVERPPHRWLGLTGSRGGSAVRWVTAAGLMFGSGLVATAFIGQARRFPGLQESPSPAPLGYAMSGLAGCLLLIGLACFVTEWRRRAAGAAVVRAHRDRYVDPAELDEPAACLLRRAQQAIDTVVASGVYRAGLLDRPGNDVVFAAQEWEIAVELRTHSRLRAALRCAIPFSGDRSVAVLLRPQHEALARSVRSIEVRVAALERYAQRVRDADTAYGAWRITQDLTAQDHIYRELLARTEVHSHALTQIDELNGRAAALVDGPARSATRPSRPPTTPTGSAVGT